MPTEQKTNLHQASDSSLQCLPAGIPRDSGLDNYHNHTSQLFKNKPLCVYSAGSIYLDNPNKETKQL
jgi:hypothetical protein